MSEEKSKQPVPSPANSFSFSKNYPRIVVMNNKEDVFKNRVIDLYNQLYLKDHDRYTTEQIFALAYQATLDFENYWTEISTHVNINFEDEIKKYGGPEALEAVKKLSKEKEAKRRTR